jgi:predicted amidohydrolase
VIAAAVQYAPPHGNPDKARSDILELAHSAGSQHAELIVFPEMATSGYVWTSSAEILAHAEKPDGTTFSLLSECARRYSSWIVCGYPELSHNVLYNSAMIISPDGSLALNYRKVLLFELDTLWAESGTERMTLDTPFGTMSPGICMDLNDDAFIEYIISTKTRIVPFCTNWLEEGLDVHAYWNIRLEDFNGYIIAANRWGIEADIPFCGASAIIGPDKKMLAQAPKDGNCIIYAEI